MNSRPSTNVAPTSGLTTSMPSEKKPRPSGVTSRQRPSRRSARKNPVASKLGPSSSPP
jgi:hypothetical protein